MHVKTRRHNEHGYHSTPLVEVAQSCLTPCNPMDYIVCEILQARILEW